MAGFQIYRRNKASAWSRAGRVFDGLFLVLTIFATGCSLRPDHEYIKPETTDVSNWRQYVGVAVAIQFLLLAWVFWTTHRRARMSRLFLALLLLPLIWTKVGEWIYRLGLMVLDMGFTGKLLAIFLSFVGGITGTSNVYSYAVGSVFNDIDFLLYWVVPGVASSYLAAIAYLIRGPKKK